MNLEKLLTAEQGFRLTTATPLQRAICRAETGEPLEELAALPEVVEAFGGANAVASLPNVAPSVVALLAAIRTAKSLKVACKAFRATQVCDLSKLRSSDIARYSIVSLDKDKARVTFEHLVGSVMASPVLRPMIIGEPKADSVLIYNATYNRPVEVKVIAGKRAGGGVVSTWSTGLAADEAARMQGQEDGVVNLPDLLTAARGRLLPGAQIDLLSSPWAPRGPIHDMYVDRFGRPGADLLFMVAKGPDMNPFHFTPEYCAQLEKQDPRAYRTDVLALFADPEDSLLSSIDVEACTRREPLVLDPDESMECVAAIDPATRRNAWTLTVLRTPADGRHEVVLAKQWMGSKSAPLSPGRMFQDIAALLRPYGVRSVWSDQASFDANYELAEQAGLSLMQHDFSEAEWRTAARLLEKHVTEHTISLPPDAAMRADILGMQRRLTNRSWTIALPTTVDGRHGDFAPSLCLALRHAPSAPIPVEESRYQDPDEQRICDLLNSKAANPMRFAAERIAESFS